MKKKIKSKNEHFTIMIIPHSQKNIISLKIPYKYIRASFYAIAIFLLLFVSLFFSLSFYKSLLIAKSAELNRIKEVNQQQEKELEQLKHNKEMIEQKLNALIELEKRVRSMMGLKNETSRGENIDRESYINSESNASELDNDDSADLDNLMKSLETEIESYNKLVGEVKDKLAFLEAKPTIYPVSGRITSGFGYRKSPREIGSTYHKGIDIEGNVGTPIKAAGKGIVIYSGWQSGYGYTVIISHGYGITTVYAHNSKNLVKKGQIVKKGDIIAKLGNTGRSTGPHVHFEIRINGQAVDPIKYLQGGI